MFAMMQRYVERFSEEDFAEYGLALAALRGSLPI
jgi:hypothetical protein